MKGRPHSWLGLPPGLDALLAVLILAGVGLFALVAVVVALMLPHRPTGGTLPSGPAPPSGTVLFHDDFADPASGWYQPRLRDGSLSYADGGYRVDISRPHGGIAAPHPRLQNLGDVRVEVDATTVDGPAHNVFGITCRDRDDDNFYLLAIGSDGAYQIVKVKWGAWITLASSGAPGGVVKGGYATNHLRADCIGDTLTLWANGQVLLTAQDADFRAGRVRLSAAAYETPGVGIVFTDLVVLQP